MADPVADWKKKRQMDSLDSAIVREKGVTPAWTLETNEKKSSPVLIGETAGSLIFSPVRPAHAQTPFDPPMISSLGQQHQAEHGMARYATLPEYSFYGPYGDMAEHEHYEKAKGERGHKHYGVFAVNIDGGGQTARPPNKNPGPGQHDISHIVAACGRQILSTKVSEARVPAIAESAVAAGKNADILSAHLAKAPTPGPADYGRGATSHIDASGTRSSTGGSLANAITSSTIGVAVPGASQLPTAPSFTLTSKARDRPNTNPGPGDYTYGVYEPLNGNHHIVTETTLGRTATHPADPVAVMMSRDPKHPAKEPRPATEVGKKEDYRGSPDRWTSRVRLAPKSSTQTEARAAVYSSFGAQTGARDRSSSAFTIRALHVNRSRKTGDPKAPPGTGAF